MPSEEWKMKNFHEKWYAGEAISVGIGQGAVAVTPDPVGAGDRAELLPAASSSAPTWLIPTSCRPNIARRCMTRIRARGDATIPISPANWETITDGMAAVTDHTAARHARVAPGQHRFCRQDRHGAGGEPQRRHEKVSADVASRAERLVRGDRAAAESGYRGRGFGGARRLGSEASAPMAARVIETFVDKQRRLDNNLLEAKAPSTRWRWARCGPNSRSRAQRGARPRAAPHDGGLEGRCDQRDPRRPLPAMLRATDASGDMTIGDALPECGDGLCALRRKPAGCRGTCSAKPWQSLAALYGG